MQPPNDLVLPNIVNQVSRSKIVLYQHPGEEKAIEVPQGHYAFSDFVPSKEYLHTYYLWACIGFGLLDVDTRLGFLSHIDEPSSLDILFNNVLLPRYEGHSKPLKVGIAGGIICQDESKKAYAEIIRQLPKLGLLEVVYLDVLTCTEIFDQRHLHVGIKNLEIKSGKHDFLDRVNPEPDYDVCKPIW